MVPSDGKVNEEMFNHHEDTTNGKSLEEMVRELRQADIQQQSALNRQHTTQTYQNREDIFNLVLHSEHD